MLINFTIALLEHALTIFPNLLYFVDSWVHTIIWAKMHTTKFLEIKTKKKTKQS